MFTDWTRSWTRPEFVSAVFFFCFANGVATKAQIYVEHNGVWPSVFGLFGISAIVYICLFMSLSNALKAKISPLTSVDVLLFGSAVAVNLISSPVLSWVCLTMLAVREYYLNKEDANLRRAAVLMIGVTVPLFWGRLVFGLLSSSILAADALLVSFLTGTTQVGNVIALPNGKDYIWIADACSSFGNISLAILCWLMFMEYRGRQERVFADYVACLFACINVVIINVTRISIIVFRPDLYEFVHGPYGSALAGYISTLLVIFVCSSGIRRETKPAF